MNRFACSARNIYPRVAFALWLGGIATLILLIIWLILQGYIHASELLGFVIAPGVCAAISGAIFGGKLFDLVDDPRHREAFWVGARGAIVAYAIYVPVFGIGAYFFSDRSNPMLALTLSGFVLFYGLVLAPIAGVIGGISAWLFHRLSRTPYARRLCPSSMTT